MPYTFNPFTGNFDAVNVSFKTFVPTAGTNVVADNANDTVTLTSTDSSLIITGTAATDTLNFAVNTAVIAANSFVTISTPAGTSPVADTSTDTLTLAVGSGITVTGNATTDTVTFANTGALTAFTTIDCPSGTDPVSDSATDTLTLTSTDSSVVITGNSTTDTIDFTGGSAAFAFKTIACPAGTNPVADQMADTLTLTAGTGLTITGQAITDTIAFANTLTLSQALTNGNSSGGVNILMSTTDQIQWRDSALFINSSVDGQLDIDADVELELTSPTVDINASTGLFLGGANLAEDWLVDTDKKIGFRNLGHNYIRSPAAQELELDARNILRLISAGYLDLANAMLGTNWLVDAANEIRFRDTSTRLYSNASNQVTLEATTMTNIGVVGDIQLGDGTLRVMYPQTDAKIDLGSTSFMFNAAWFKGVVNANTAGLRTKRATTNTANPPTNAELVTAFGSAATTGSGFIGILDDNNAGTNEYIVWSDGTNYFYATGTKAV